MTTSAEAPAGRGRGLPGRPVRVAALLALFGLAPAAGATDPFEELLAAVAVPDEPAPEADPAEPPEKPGTWDLGDGWTLSTGGQIRLRSMNENNKALTNVSPRRNDYYLSRVLVHADLRNEDGFRAYLEGVDARIHGESRPPLPIDRNTLDVRNLFIEYDAGLPTFRLGRMDLQEGAQRLISPLEWGNTRRAFEGGLVRLDHEGGSHTSLFVTRPVEVDPHHTDHRDSSRWFSGVYHTGRWEDDPAEYDLFVLAANEEDDVFTDENGDPGNEDLYTIGGRWKDRCGDTIYEIWGAHQTGSRGGDSIDANAVSIAIDHVFPEYDGKPAIGLDLDWASGDNDPDDGTHETFNQLYPLGHAYFGYLDLVGRQNIIGISPNASIDVAERTRLGVAWHDFRLAAEEDSLYNAGGAASFTDPSGDASDDVGSEFDVTLKHTPTWWDGGSILVGWSKFWAGDHIDDLGGDGNADLLYVQLTLPF